MQYSLVHTGLVAGSTMLDASLDLPVARGPV